MIRGNRIATACSVASLYVGSRARGSTLGARHEGPGGLAPDADPGAKPREFAHRRKFFQIFERAPDTTIRKSQTTRLELSNLGLLTVQDVTWYYVLCPERPDRSPGTRLLNSHV